MKYKTTYLHRRHYKTSGLVLLSKARISILPGVNGGEHIYWEPWINIRLRGTADIEILCLSTVAKSGITPSKHSFNSLNIARNPIRAAVLAEPFPWTVTQGVILLLR